MSDASQIQAVLWDFGGVFTGSPFHSLAGYAQSLGTTQSELADLVLGYHLADSDHPWHRLERGEMPFERAVEAVTQLAVKAGLADFSIWDFFDSMGGLDGSANREPMLDVVRAVRAHGLANAIITNNIRELNSRWRSVIPDGLFDDIVDSSEVGVRKPDPTIFRLALERLGGVAPHQAVFLDDHAANVHSAAALGIHGIVVGADPLLAAAELVAMLGLEAG